MVKMNEMHSVYVLSVVRNLEECTGLSDQAGGFIMPCKGDSRSAQEADKGMFFRPVISSVR
jgi:hypothetical protein